MINTDQSAVPVLLTFNLTLPAIQTDHSIDLFECDHITRLETMHLVVQRCHNTRILLNHNHPLSYIEGFLRV